ncbi:MAG: NB-ARC domain-containing protein [Chloroflexota bacterium]
MTHSAPKFGGLLTQGVNHIKAQANKSVAAIQDELGYAVERKGSSAIEHWRRGNVPDVETVETLAREIVNQSSADRDWLRSFLSSANHPRVEELCNELFPSPSDNGTQPQPIRWRLPSHFPDKRYDQLFGRKPLVQEVLNALVNEGGPSILALDGIGGIGKTALAYEICEAAWEDQHFDQIGWVSAEQQQLHIGNGILPVSGSLAPSTTELLRSLAEQLLPEPALVQGMDHTELQAALQTYLDQSLHLVVVDNLETLEDMSLLVPELRRLANPTRFLLTARHSLHAEEGFSAVKVPELAQGDAINLIRHEARHSSSGKITTASDAALQSIWEVVGGNPLALRLVVGQLHSLSLNQVLSSLQEAQGASTEALYTYIYRQVWDSLSKEEHTLFLTTPLMPIQGESLEFLEAVSRLERKALLTSLHSLVTRNLIDHQPSLELQRSTYTIHSLTRTFLMEQVIKWQ